MLGKKKIVFDCIYKTQRNLDMNPVAESGAVAKSGAKMFEKVEWPAKTMGKCPAFFMAGQSGFIIGSPIAFNMKLYPNEDADINWPNFSKPPPVNRHAVSQYDPYFKGMSVFKIETDLYIKEKTGLSCFYHGAWQFNQDINSKFFVPSGFIDYKYNNCTNIFFMLKTPESGCTEINVKYGDPMIQVIPLTEKSISLNHIVDGDFKGVNTTSQEMISMDAPEYTVRKRLLIKNEKKCPFSKLFRK